MAIYNCSAIFSLPDRIEVWFDRIGGTTIVRQYSTGSTDLPELGKAYDEADIPAVPVSEALPLDMGGP